jgi:hypothetical protein
VARGFPWQRSSGAVRGEFIATILQRALRQPQVSQSAILLNAKFGDITKKAISDFTGKDSYEVSWFFSH